VLRRAGGRALKRGEHVAEVGPDEEIGLLADQMAGDPGGRAKHFDPASQFVINPVKGWLSIFRT
jgi:hypothetical protein